MIKMKVKNQILLLKFQSSLTNGILVNIYDSHYRLLFDLAYENPPDIDELKEVIKIQLYPKKEAQRMMHKKEEFENEFNLLGDLFSPSLFGYFALNNK
ncbi:hypothetical protein [Helicobacter sp. 13S00477-4]|uniref:hypothetical protein n=1 Tax=Helicobacter sp. 13S00477-4 TaxID=1905759 RepID=UPI000BA7D3A0|nr:hypothetical protein [Helicobacter sp. 13S00477-4]PAF50477.1 hypothetical protein BKH44_08170 [Helicobacter sp. 13S00477-4]